MKKCKSPKGRAQIDSLRPKKVPYSLCRDVMARACTESNQRSKGKLEAQLPFKIPPILHTYTVDVYRYKTIESTGKNFVTFVLKFFHIDSIGITYKCTRKKLVYKSYKVFFYRFYRYPTTV